MNEEKPNLGLATTRELLAELTARIEVDGKLDYSTVGGLNRRPENTLLRGTVDDNSTDDDDAGAPDTIPERKLPAGKRVIRTKTSGDRVYLIDEVKKTRQWITNQEVLASLGFEMGDVTESDDEDILTYQMGPAIYRVES